MEAFLSTLPPYVHDFIGKHPPTDVFNILRELVCFAVLYSDDRNHINSSADLLLKKKQDREVKSRRQYSQLKNLYSYFIFLFQSSEKEAVVPEAHSIKPIKEETEVEIKETANEAVKEEKKLLRNVRTGELIREESLMPNTFPEWWGHPDKELDHDTPPRKETPKRDTTPEPQQPESYGSAWISCKILYNSY